MSCFSNSCAHQAHAGTCFAKPNQSDISITSHLRRREVMLTTSYGQQTHAAHKPCALTCQWQAQQLHSCVDCRPPCHHQLCNTRSKRHKRHPCTKQLTTSMASCYAAVNMSPSCQLQSPYYNDAHSRHTQLTLSIIGSHSKVANSPKNYPAQPSLHSSSCCHSTRLVIAACCSMLRSKHTLEVCRKPPSKRLVLVALRTASR